MESIVDKNAVNDVWEILNEIPDPEIPVISLVELGVIRDVQVDGEIVKIKITPTYTGCPATNIFEQDIRSNLKGAGYSEIKISFQYHPAWTSDWLNAESREKLRKYGIAPPKGTTLDKSYLLGMPPTVKCPQCKSSHTQMISEFGATACKALYKCLDCLEPFDYFKCI